MILKLIWTANAKKRIENAQKVVDSKTIEYMGEFVPAAKPKWRNAGRLKNSVQNPQPGKIVYTAPFARKDYYARKNHRNSGNPQATRLWLETTKAKYRKKILAAARKESRK